jgi:hypothetical protein
MEIAEVNSLMKNLEMELDDIKNPSEVSSDLGQFMGINDDVLGIGIYSLFGNSLFTSSKNENGDVGLTAFKSLLSMVGNQIDFILPPEKNVQFIAPEDILIGVTKIGPDKIFAVVLERNARIATLVPNILRMSKLLKGISKKTGTLSNSKCKEACEETMATRTRYSHRKNIVRRFAG